MWRPLYLALALLLLCPLAFCQTTAVSGTITDASGQAWFGGTYSVSFKPSPSNPFGPYYYQGAPFNTFQSYHGSLNGSAAYSQSLPSNTAIKPAGSTWVFTFCPLASSTCYTMPQGITVTGATQTYSPTPPGISISLILPFEGPVRAYSDSEISAAAIGSIYYNLVSSISRQCTAVNTANQACTAWQNIGGSSSTGQVTASATAEQFGASPSASASTNTAAIQSALNVGGTDTLSTCGTYQVNAPLVISSNTRFIVAPCVELFQANGTNNNMIVSHAFTQRGYLSGTFTYVSGASGCPANTTQYVAFINGNGVGGHGTISINNSGVPTGNVTLDNPGAYYSSTTPTTAAIYNSSGTYACGSTATQTNPATFSGGTVVNPTTPVTLTWSASTPEQVTVNCGAAIAPCSTFYNGGNTLAQQAYSTISNAYPSALNCTCLVETVPSSSSYTYRLRRNPIFTTQTTAASVTSNVATLTAGSNPQLLGFAAGQSISVTGFSGSDTYFNGTYTISTVTSTQITYALTHANGSATTNGVVALNGVTTDHGGSVVAMQADQNIIIEGGQWDYNGPNNSSANGYTIGSTIVMFAAQNVEIRDINFIQPKYNTVLFGAVSDFHLHDLTDEGSGAVQFFECQGPCYNGEVDHITSTGWDDGMSMLTRISSGYYSNVILSYGDVQNSGFRHINRLNPNNVNSGATGEVMFYGSQFEYMGGVYARDIGGSPSLQGGAGGTNDVACVGVASLFPNTTIDTVDIENVNGSCTWQVRIAATSPDTTKVNHLTVKNVTCNPQQSSGGEGEECIQFTGYVTIGKVEIEKLTYTSTSHAVGSVPVIESGANIQEMDVTDANVQPSGIGAPITFIQINGIPGVSSQIVKLNISRLMMGPTFITPAVVVDGSLENTAMITIIKDSTFNAYEAVLLNTTATAVNRTYILRDNTMTGMVNGAVDIGPAGGTINVYSSGNSMSGTAYVAPALNTCGTLCTVNLYDGGERGSWTYSNAGVAVFTSVANASGGHTTYTGTVSVCPAVGILVNISGFSTSANNGYFPFVSCVPGVGSGTMTVSNSSGVSETASASAAFALVNMIPPGPCQGAPAIFGTGFNTGTVTGPSPCAFKITVGSVSPGNSADLAMPWYAQNGWNCAVSNLTNFSRAIFQTFSSVNTASFSSQQQTLNSTYAGGSQAISSIAASSGGVAVYTFTSTPANIAVNSIVVVNGAVNNANNGAYIVTAVNLGAKTVTLANNAAVIEGSSTATAFALFGTTWANQNFTNGDQLLFQCSFY